MALMGHFSFMASQTNHNGQKVEYENSKGPWSTLRDTVLEVLPKSWEWSKGVAVTHKKVEIGCWMDKLGVTFENLKIMETFPRKIYMYTHTETYKLCFITHQRCLFQNPASLILSQVWSWLDMK